MSTEQRSNVYSWDTHQIYQPEGTSAVLEETFKIRHLKAGRTGARKTWAAAPELLRYLTHSDGLRSLDEKIFVEKSVFDMNAMALESEKTTTAMTLPKPNELCNILELGGGSGFVSVGLAKAFHSSSAPLSHNAKIMCTDMDKNTIKNMRHNICQTKETKTVAVENLEWGYDVGGEKFDKALERKFRVTKSSYELKGRNPDPVKLLTHIIASDVHYGETTLDPLSSIIASLKFRNPHAQVIIMLHERSPNAIAELVEQIETKVHEKEDGHNFIVRVRDVVQSCSNGAVKSELKMKLIEC